MVVFPASVVIVSGDDWHFGNKDLPLHILEVDHLET